MAAGAKPALESMVDAKPETPQASDPKPLTMKERIIRKLSEIFQHNEDLGVTR